MKKKEKPEATEIVRSTTETGDENLIRFSKWKHRTKRERQR